MISAATLIATLALLVRTHAIHRHQSNLAECLTNVSKSLDMLAECARQNQTAEQNTIKALNQICEALNKSFDTQADFMNRTTFGLQTLAVCMLPFIDEIKECAIEDEEYEKAAECIRIIENLIKIVNDHE